MLPPSVVGAVAGGYAAGHLPANTLRIVIGARLARCSGSICSGRDESAAAGASREPDLRAAVIAAGRDRSDRRPDRADPRNAARPGAHPLGRRGTGPRVGTNLVVGIAVGAAGLLGHLPGGVDWTLLAVGAATSVPGALLGSRYTGRLSAAALLRAIGVILLVSGTITIVRGVV